MTSPTWQKRLDDLVQFNRQDMYQNVDARIDETYDILDTFLTNPTKPLTEFLNYTDEVQLVDPSGKPKVEPAPFIPAQNEREQLKAIFKVELHKQWGYCVAEFRMIHKRCMHHFGCWLTMGHIPDIPAYNIRNKQTETFIGERQMWRQAFHELVDQFLSETKNNLTQTIEDNVAACVDYAGGDSSNLLGSTGPLLTVEKYRVFARSEATNNALKQSINRFFLKLKQPFQELRTFLVEKMKRDAARDNQQQNDDAPMEDE